MPSNFKVLAGASGEPIDPNFRNVTLLLHGDGNNGGQNNAFVDSSSNHFPISRNGNTTQGSLSPYGSNWSNYFNGTNSRMSVADNAAFGFGTGNFTIEFWLYYTGGNGYKFFFVNNSGSGNYVGYGLQIGTLTPWIWNNGDVLVASSNITPNTWQHHAVVRNGSTLTIYLNGVAIGSITWTIDLGNSRPLTIGWNGGNDNQSTPGYFSNFRVIKGTALYTTNFTPPTTPLTAITNTSLLTCQSNRFRDLSTNNFTITTSGEVSVSNFGPFAPSSAAVYDQSDVQYWSGAFDGSGDYGRISSSQTALQFGTGDFTVEGWVYSTGATGAYQQILTGGSSWTSGSGGVYWYYNGGSPYIGAAWNQIATNPAVNSGTLATNTWHHFAIVRSGNTLTLYINGSSVDTLDVTGVSIAVNNQSQTNIGGGGWDQDFGGYLSNLRVVKGAAVYTSNFTPPTSPLTAISGTSLLTLQSAAFTDNSANKFSITVNGNATVIGNSPYNPVGYWSNYFDGSGDYLTLPSNSVLDVSSGNFTIEAWVYATSSVQLRTIYSNWWDGTSGGVLFALNGTTPAFFWRPYDAASPMITGPAVTLNTWTHVAVVRNGNTFTIYTNGVAGSPISYSTNCVAGEPYIIGAYARGASGNYVGYISNLRVVKGTAVYTSNFTPSTAPLTDISGTSLLTCQANRFIDSSANAFTITRNGDVSVVDFDPFTSAAVTSTGGSSYYDGDTDYLSINNNAAFVLNGTFTLESWVYPTGDYLKYQCIITKRAGDTPAAWQLFMNINNGYLGYYNGTGYVSSAPVPLNQWSHVAAVYDGTNINLYLNGVRVLQSATTNTDQSTGVKIGYHFSSVAEPFKGYLADVRVVKGVQVYSGTTYTVPTAPLTAISGTSLLVNGRNAAIFDNSMKNNFETVGNAQISTSVKKFGTGSMYFDGSGDTLIAPSNPDLALGSGPFTVEMWMYWNAVTNIGEFACFSITGSGGCFTFYYSGGTLQAVATGGAGVTSGSWTPSTGQWYHVAATRDASNVQRIFINGTLLASSTSTNNYGQNGFTMSYNSSFNGYIDEFRVTKGVARYTANFTPPAAPFPNK